MPLVRRLTIHGLVLVATTVVAVGFAALLSCLTGVLIYAVAGKPGAWEASRGELAIGLAALIPGIALALAVRPATRRLLAEPGELTTTTRATYRTGLLLAALFITFSAIQAGATWVLASSLFTDPSLYGEPGLYGEPSMPGSVFDSGSVYPTLLAIRAFFAAGVVGYATWLWQGWRRVREVRRERPAGTAARITRLGLYVGLVYAVGTVASMLSAVLSAATSLLLQPPAASGPSDYYTSGFMGPQSMLFVAGVQAVPAVLFLVPSVAYARHLVRPGQAFAAQEARSRIRRGAWIVLALVLVGDLVQSLFGVLGPLVRTVLGMAQDWPAAGAAAAGALPIIVAGYLVWRSHRSEVRRLAPSDPEAAGRPWCLAFAAWGVAIGAVGAVLALAVILSWAVGDPDLPFAAKSRFAEAAPPLVVGTLAWSAGWFMLRRRTARDVVRELAGVGRRAYVGTVGVGAVVATVAAAAVVAAQVLSVLFGGESDGLAVGLVVPVASLAVGALLAFLAWRTWRRDAQATT